MGRKKPKFVNQTTTQTSSPWAPQASHLQRLFTEAGQQIRDRPLQYFGQSTVSPFSADTEQALNMMRQQALQGSPVAREAGAELTRTLRGDYLQGEQFNRAFDAARRQIMPAITSQFARAGRGRGGGVQAAMASALGDAFTGLQSQERSNMMSAMGMAPAISNLGYSDIERLGRVGAMRDDMADRLLQERIARHQFEQDEPFNRLMRYAQLVGGNNYGGTTVGVVPQMVSAGGSRLGNVFGGALSGAAIGGRGGSGYGAAVGGILGGIGGLFS